MGEKDSEAGFKFEDRRSFRIKEDGSVESRAPEGAPKASSESAPPPPSEREGNQSAPLPPLSFVGFLQAQYGYALLQLGVLPEEQGQRPPQPRPDLARQVIDLLALLQEKTRGNLTPEENLLLNDILFDLRLRYVEATRT